jgi:CBS domain containing-hemolysin-like protein
MMLLGFMVLLILLNGFFVSIEYAIVKVRHHRIDSMAEAGRKRAVIVKGMLGQLEQYLSACQVGITLCSLGLGWLSEPIIATMLYPLFEMTGLHSGVLRIISLTIAFLLIAMMHIVFGELAPKTVAILKAESIVMWFARPMKLFFKLMYPLVWILQKISTTVLKIVGVAPSTGQTQLHTEDEIRIMMKESSERGLIDSTEMSLVDNIFEFADTTAREIMIPRTEMQCLYIQDTLEENLNVALEGTRTRYPVCDEDKDHIIGFFHIKDLIKSNQQHYMEFLRPIMAVPESIPISTLMKRLQRTKSQIAILIDEYGGTSGMVTLEDIVEQIVGEIQDEFDEERPSVEQTGNAYSVDGMMLIDSINHIFGLDLDSEGYDTIGGWLYSRLPVLPPRQGASFHYKNFLFSVEELDHKRIARISLVREEAYVQLEELSS